MVDFYWAQSVVNGTMGDALDLVRSQERPKAFDYQFLMIEGLLGIT